MRQQPISALLLMISLASVAFGRGGDHHHPPRSSRDRHDGAVVRSKKSRIRGARGSSRTMSRRNSRGGIRHEGAKSRSQDILAALAEALPTAKKQTDGSSSSKEDKCDSAPGGPVQCQKGGRGDGDGQHLVAQIFRNACYAHRAGFRYGDCLALIHPHQKSHSRDATGHSYWRSHNSRSVAVQKRNSSGSHRRLQFCIALYNPVTCLLSGVEFPSRCDAELAGYDAGDCTAPTHPAMKCPSSDAKPVSCGTDKEDFPNICLASEAGYDPSKDCENASANERPGNKRIENPFTVATVGESRCIGKKIKPWKCGPDLDVPFDNLCLARVAGYKKSMCVKVDE